MQIEKLIGKECIFLAKQGLSDMGWIKPNLVLG